MVFVWSDYSYYWFISEFFWVLSSPSFTQFNAELNCSKRMLKLTLKFTVKALLHISVIQTISSPMMVVRSKHVGALLT
jgi:hypothetical protein